MRAPIAECLPFINNSIVSVIDKRREKFIARNLGNPLIRHTESLRFSEGRKLRVWREYTDKSAPSGPMRPFYLHKDVFFFSGSSYGDIPQLEGCIEGQINENVVKTPENERRFDGGKLPRIRVRPAHKNDGLEDAEMPLPNNDPTQREVIIVEDDDDDSGLAHDHGYSCASLQRAAGSTQTQPDISEDSGLPYDHNYSLPRARNPSPSNSQEFTFDISSQEDEELVLTPRPTTQQSRAVAQQGDSRFQDGAVG